MFGCSPGCIPLRLLFAGLCRFRSLLNVILTGEFVGAWTNTWRTRYRGAMCMSLSQVRAYRIPYGVRLDRFRRVSDPPKDEFRVLFAGTVSLRKGVPYLLQAFREVRHPRKRLLLVGPVLPEMQKLFSRFDMTDVEVVGAVPQTRMAEYMSSSHVMVLPSIEEGLALVQGQALACGCPVISSIHTGAEDLFSNGVEGFLVPIRSAGAIAERLQEVADDPGLRQRMSEAALARVHHLGGWSDYGNTWERLVTELVARRDESTTSARATR